ncbi:unnamed protein product [Discosporangium mesarthrocarpum]
MWFRRLAGFEEECPDQVRDNLRIEGTRLISEVTGKEYTCGRLEIVSLGELLAQVEDVGCEEGHLSVQQVVADVRALHASEANADTLFQVASQFNLLEMVSPGVTPEEGVGIYELDHTQGPACAIAAGAGTIFRNYFCPVNGQVGQSATNQLDCLAGLGSALGNEGDRLWRMQNGYVIPSRSGLEGSGLDKISSRLRGSSPEELDELRRSVRIGLQWQTQVTIEGCKHLVSQAYCAAMPVAYSLYPAKEWREFAQLVLDAAYEATLAAGILNRKRTGNRVVYLTLLGGGVFGNNIGWILSAMGRALQKYRLADLDVVIVSYRVSNPAVEEFIEDFSSI